MRHSTYLSIGLLIAVVLWMLSGALANVTKSTPVVKEAHGPVPVMKVQVIDVTAEEINHEIVIQGELKPLRQVEIRAQTGAKVVGMPVDRGALVEEGTPIIELAVEDRHVQLNQARAEISNLRLEVEGARKLQKEGLQSENHLKAVEASLAAAEADLLRAILELDYIRIKVPFSGVLEERYVELGSHLEKGDKVALILDESILKAVGHVSQQSAGMLSLGQLIKVRLLDGRDAQGRITYISRLGDSVTHSFRVEAEIPNPEGKLKAGVSAELHISVGSVSAHFLSPALLALSDKGEVGIKSVDQKGKVRFHAIDLVRTEANGVWVSGLPAKVRVITQGQGFVNEGEAVHPVPAS